MKKVFNLSAEFDRNAFNASVSQFLEKGDTVKLERISPPRSNSQNRYYWSLLAILGDHTGYHSEEVHDLCIKHYSPEYKKESTTGKKHTFKKRTKDMDTKEFSEYLDKVRTMGDRIGCYLPTADEYKMNWREIEAQYNK